MRLVLLTGWFGFFIFLCGLAFAQDTNKRSILIPLDQIWGYNLPGTKDVAGIPFPDDDVRVGQTFAFRSREREFNIEQIRRALASKPPGEKALPGFVFPRRSDSLTLRGVQAPLLRKPSPVQRSFPEGEFTLIFFSHPLSYYARLRKVERIDNEITVAYQFEPHTTPEATVHFALIPLGKLTADEYKVVYKQIPIDDIYREAGFEPVHPDATEIVCRDFNFTVDAASKNETQSQGQTLIPLRDVWGYDMPKTRDASQLDSLKSNGGTSHPIINSLTRIISERFKRNDKAGPAFVVQGTGKSALENMLTAFEDEPPRYVPHRTDVSLIFYTRLSGYFVHLESIERVDNRFIVTYRFVEHPSRNLSFHFALIPLGKMSAGTYEIEMKQAAPIDDAGRRITLEQDLNWVVCQNATFYVEGS
jgi:hypothetical protein